MVVPVISILWRIGLFEKSAPKMFKADINKVIWDNDDRVMKWLKIYLSLESRQFLKKHLNSKSQNKLQNFKIQLILYPNFNVIANLLIPMLKKAHQLNHYITQLYQMIKLIIVKLTSLSTRSSEKLTQQQFWWGIIRLKVVVVVVIE